MFHCESSGTSWCGHTRHPHSIRLVPRKTSGGIWTPQKLYQPAGERPPKSDSWRVDAIDGRSGWQIKSTRAETPVTWKRAKIANAEELIEQSFKSERGLRELGDAIINFCNDHASASIERYSIEQIGYARLVLHQKERRVDYFERLLCTKQDPRVFRKEEFSWSWSTPKITKRKEQLRSLIGTRKEDGEKWFAWHGLGENQLHFSGERAWWPQQSEKMHSFDLPGENARLSWQEALTILAEAHDP